jgi:cysteine desulfurase
MGNIELFIVLIILLIVIIVIVVTILMTSTQGITEVYFDNNATTIPPDRVGTFMVKWMKMGNPSASYSHADSVKKLIEATNTFIYDLCSIKKSDYTIIYNSGASEGNSFIIRSTVEAYRTKHRSKCHIVTSAIEHNSILHCLDQLAAAGLCDVTKVATDLNGLVDPIDVSNAFQSNTVLVSIMYANNEIGSINNIKQIGKLCHDAGIPLHSDLVQVFGKAPIPLRKKNIDAATISFHKLYGPQGIGAVIISNDLLKSYELKAQICGSQMYGLRGGTENVMGIAGALAGMKYNFRDREKKNEKLIEMTSTIYKYLHEVFPFSRLEYYLNDTYMKHKPNLSKVELVLLGPPINNKSATTTRLPNTLLIAVCKNRGEMFCNVELKDDLLKKGYIISIGSACNTSSKTSSHVVSSFNPHLIVKRGVIRISLGDQNTVGECKKFAIALVECIKKQCKDIE